MRKYKGKISIQRPNMLLVNSPFVIEAIGLPEALIEMFRLHVKRGAIMGFSITDVTMKKSRDKWLKEEYNK